VIKIWFARTRKDGSCPQERSAAGVDRGRVRAAVHVLGVVLALAGCGNGGLLNTRSEPPVVERSTSKVPDDYLIGSGDSLSIFVYRNPDLSESAVAVRPDGRISTPLIEDISAAGKTPTQLAREIEQRLTKYIQEPNVTVIVRGFIGAPDRQVRVIGEATDPIAIPYDAAGHYDSDPRDDKIRRGQSRGDCPYRCGWQAADHQGAPE
jgi:hypothetical protein